MLRPLLVCVYLFLSFLVLITVLISFVLQCSPNAGQNYVYVFDK